MESKPDNTLICRGCMKVNCRLVSMYNDELTEIKLPERLAELASININEYDGMPVVLCSKCVYRTTTFHDFKLQVQESERLLRQMFESSMDNSISETLAHEMEETALEPSCQSEYYEFQSSEQTYLDNDLSSVFVDTNYSHDDVKSSPIEKLKGLDVTKDNQCVISADSPDQDEQVDKPSMDYFFFYVSNEKVDNDMKSDCQDTDNTNIISQTSSLEGNQCATNDSKNDISDSDSEDEFYRNDNLVGSLNDTVVKIKESKLDDGSIQYHCTLCMENYSELSGILSHTVEYHIPSDGPFYCVVCEKDCQSHKELRSHVKIHTGRNPYICFICKKAYSSKRYLKRHMICHTDFPRHRCSKCGLRFKTKTDLENHTKTHNNATSYLCTQCPRRFNHKANYKQHLISHLDPQRIRLPKYPCHLCGKRFLNNRTLKTHTRVHTGEKPYKCQVCDRSFSQQGNLVNHARIHSNPRSYMCQVCGKRFNQRSTLRDHGLLHTGEKPYICNVCGLAYTFSAALRRHMWTHAGDKPYGCEVCDARFVGRYDLKRHQKIHSGRPTPKRKNQLKDQHEFLPQVTSTVDTIFIEDVFVDDNGTQINMPQEDSDYSTIHSLY